MNNDLAKKHDQFLTFLSGAFQLRNKLSQSDLLQAGNSMNISDAETLIIADILVADGLLNQQIKSFKGGQIADYTYNPAMAKFIYNDKGYKKKRIRENRNETNSKFTLARNWVWFIGLILSLLLNGYLIAQHYILN